MKKILLLSFTLITLFFNEAKAQYTASQIKNIWEKRYFPNVPDIDSTFDAFLYVNDNANQINSEDYIKTASTTLTTITGLSGDSILSGGYYSFSGTFFLAASSTGSFKIGIGGTATATTILYEVRYFNNVGDSSLAGVRVSSMGSSASCNSGSWADVIAYVTGTIRVSSSGGGTLYPTFAQLSAAGTSTIAAGSNFAISKAR